MQVHQVQQARVTPGRGFLLPVERPVNGKLYLMALAAIVLQPYAAAAQPSSGVVHEYRIPDSELPSRPPSIGFLIGVHPGPGNAYGYPYVREVVRGSVAETAGLMVGDTIVSIDGRDMRHDDFFPVKVAGTRYVMLVRRGTEELELVYVYPQVVESAGREQPTAAPPE